MMEWEPCDGWFEPERDSDQHQSAGICLVYNCGDGCCFDEVFVCFDCYSRLRWTRWPSYYLATWRILIRDTTKRRATLDDFKRGIRERMSAVLPPDVDFSEGSIVSRIADAQAESAYDRYMFSIDCMESLPMFKAESREERIAALNEIFGLPNPGEGQDDDQT